MFTFPRSYPLEYREATVLLQRHRKRSRASVANTVVAKTAMVIDRQEGTRLVSKQERSGGTRGSASRAVDERSTTSKEQE